MEKTKSLLYPSFFLLLATIASFGGFLSFLIFPALGFLLWFLVNAEGIRSEIKTAIVGFCLLIVFLVWQYLEYQTLQILFAIIYTFALMAAIEGWRFTIYYKVNVWGLMNLVVFWIALEYLMLLWLPFDSSGWIIGKPLLKNNAALESWLLYSGKLGYSLWALLGGLLLFKGFDKKPVAFKELIGAAVVILLPFLIRPGIDAAENLHAQGEWIGRTSIWLSVLILVYSFVKRKTKEK